MDKHNIAILTTSSDFDGASFVEKSSQIKKFGKHSIVCMQDEEVPENGARIALADKWKSSKDKTNALLDLSPLGLIVCLSFINTPSDSIRFIISPESSVGPILHSFDLERCFNCPILVVELSKNGPLHLSQANIDRIDAAIDRLKKK